MNRREFIGGLASIVAYNRQDPIAASEPARWAAGELDKAIQARGLSRKLRVTASGGLRLSARSESFRIVGKSPELRVEAGDERGLVYGLLEIADIVRYESDPMAALLAVKPAIQTPANRVRSITRLFCSDVEDKPWFNDREMWPEYLTMLATNRFNRFSLALGIGYDFIRQVTDAYFLFPYPFLLSVPGHNVRVPQLAEAERDANLAMLQYIARETAVRGLQFQLGLWMHGYEWIDSPNANYTIEGLTKETHGPYCRDALRLLLQKCPEISGVTFRVHGESGVEEGSYEFWKTVFDGVSTSGRPVEIDMHPKGMTPEMLAIGAAAKQPFRVSPKFWAEHMGLPYHQADIREVERPKPGKDGGTLMKYSAGSRSFLRYGYGDLLGADRKWKVMFRIWPGTQRLLLWGDPDAAAQYSRAFGFCGSDGVEICEPLSFKGRRGSGIAGDRCAYLDESLRPRWDWQKYEYGTRVWGRHLYDPNCDAPGWRRYLTRHFGDAASACENALGHASKILPIVTTAYGPSAANNLYWPEMYLNQSMVDAEHPGPYTDTLAPKVFGNASPFDPQLFASAKEVAHGLAGGRYSPVDVAEWLEAHATAAFKHLAEAKKSDSAEFRRLAIDVQIQAGLGLFFANKFRSGVRYQVFEKTGNRSSLEQAIDLYKRARAAWADLADVAKPVYVADVTVGEHPQLRGHWADRLPAIDADIRALELRLNGAKEVAVPTLMGRAAIVAEHTAAKGYKRGSPLAIGLDTKAKEVRLWYRHVNQAERFVAVEMEAHGTGYRAEIPGEYTASEFPIQYYFEVRDEEAVGLYPGFEHGPTPYFLLGA